MLAPLLADIANGHAEIHRHSLCSHSALTFSLLSLLSLALFNPLANTVGVAPIADTTCRPLEKPIVVSPTAGSLHVSSWRGKAVAIKYYRNRRPEDFRRYPPPPPPPPPLPLPPPPPPPPLLARLGSALLFAWRSISVGGCPSANDRELAALALVSGCKYIVKVLGAHADEPTDQHPLQASSSLPSSCCIIGIVAPLAHRPLPCSRVDRSAILPADARKDLVVERGGQLPARPSLHQGHR